MSNDSISRNFCDFTKLRCLLASCQAPVMASAFATATILNSANFSFLISALCAIHCVHNLKRNTCTKTNDCLDRTLYFVSKAGVLVLKKLNTLMFRHSPLFTLPISIIHIGHFQIGSYEFGNCVKSSQL